MSRPMTDRLAEFTPDGSGVDRDALLWQAGRHAGRRGRGTWMAIAGFLAVTQVATVAVLWPTTPAPVPPADRRSAITEPPSVPEPDPGPSSSEPPPLARRWELPPRPGGVPDLVPAGPSLTVHSLRVDNASDLWNF